MKIHKIAPGLRSRGFVLLYGYVFRSCLRMLHAAQTHHMLAQRMLCTRIRLIQPVCVANGDDMRGGANDHVVVYAEGETYPAWAVESCAGGAQYVELVFCLGYEFFVVVDWRLHEHIEGALRNHVFKAGGIHGIHQRLTVLRVGVHVAQHIQHFDDGQLLQGRSVYAAKYSYADGGSCDNAVAFFSLIRNQQVADALARNA